MADLHMLGTISTTERLFFNDNYLFYIGTVKNGDEEDYVSYRRGTNALEGAMFLWDIIDPQVRAKYKEFRKNEIEIESNHLNSGGYLVTVEQVKKLLDFIDNIDKKIQKFVDSKGQILPECLDYIKHKIYIPKLDDGEFDRGTLKDDLEDAQIIKRFLQEAIELKYPLAIG